MIFDLAQLKTENCKQKTPNSKPRIENSLSHPGC